MCPSNTSNSRLSAEAPFPTGVRVLSEAERTADLLRRAEVVLWKRIERALTISLSGLDFINIREMRMRRRVRADLRSLVDWHWGQGSVTEPDLFCLRKLFGEEDYEPESWF
ncbi:uncharacterized protein LOC112495357 [Cephus cinctus]|uniref:Uncharacterized protein LOC112495357 n=1 Tax=Cephus cinctus TaxID=211228 RepID=A0AAJ7RUH3_CEPCN|nr:uncharacterized protein LOC112495357 [Cephus cinctus]